MTARRGRDLRVVLEAGALRDARATAGIGRYVDRLGAELRRLEGLELVISVPARPPRSENHAYRYLHAQPRLLATVARARPALVHAVTNEPVAAFPLSRQVVTLHDVAAWTSERLAARPMARAYLAVQGRRLRRCAAVIVPSRAVAGAAAEVLGLDPGRVEVIAEGVDPGFAPRPVRGDAEARDAAGVRPGSYVLWVGSLRVHDPRKALDVLLEALAAVRTRGEGSRPHLVAAGARGAEADRVAARAAALGVPLTLTGFVDDSTLAALYRGAALAVVPSRDEGFGLPVLEALACGVPLVASAAGNIPDLAGPAARLVPPGDAAALAAAITEVLTTPGLATTLRKAGPPRARPLTWEAAARRTFEVYRRAAAV